MGRMSWAPERCTAGGALHGGALMALADSLGGICAYLNLPAGARTATISSSTNLLGAVREGEVNATFQPLHVGRSVIVVQTKLRDAAANLVAQVTQAQAVLGGRASGPPRPRDRSSPTATARSARPRSTCVRRLPLSYSRHRPAAWMSARRRAVLLSTAAVVSATKRTRLPRTP
jgi:uncharacterized protein (TIGR00369 family)